MVTSLSASKITADIFDGTPIRTSGNPHSSKIYAALTIPLMFLTPGTGPVGESNP